MSSPVKTSNSSATSTLTDSSTIPPPRPPLKPVHLTLNRGRGTHQYLALPLFDQDEPTALSSNITQGSHSLQDGKDGGMSFQQVLDGLEKRDSPEPTFGALSDDASGTDHTDTESSSVDGRPDIAAAEEIELPPPRAARALYAFEGEATFGELSFNAGAPLNIYIESFGEGWSLGSIIEKGVQPGSRGLVPLGWYAFTTELVSRIEQDERPFKLPPTATSSKIDLNSNGTPNDEEHSGAPGDDKSGDSMDSLVTEGRSSSSTVQSPKNIDQDLAALLAGSQQIRPAPPGVKAKSMAVLPIYFSQNTTPQAACFRPPPQLSPALRKASAAGSLTSRMQSTFRTLTKANIPGGWSESGAEEWVKDVNKSSTKQEDRRGIEEENAYVESGASWRSPGSTRSVFVHSPENKRGSSGNEYTAFSVTTHLDLSDSTIPDFQSSETSANSYAVTVERRFSDFSRLHRLLCAMFPIISIPPLPPKPYAGRFKAEFIESRRRDLETFLRMITRHPILVSARSTERFLTCEPGEVWDQPFKGRKEVKDPSFFSRVYHPEFNVETLESGEQLEAFTQHLKAIELGGSVHNVQATTGQVRESYAGLATSMRALAYALSSMASGSAIPLEDTRGLESGDPDYEDSGIHHRDDLNWRRRRAKALHLQNSEGAWCWREGCQDCLSLSKAIQGTAEALESSSQSYYNHAAHSLLDLEEMMRNHASPHSRFRALLDTHKSVLALYEELEAANVDPQSSDDDATQIHEAMTRCETVLNIAASEIDQIHDARTRDLREQTCKFLDDQIATYSDVIARLSSARALFEDQQYSNLAGTGPRIPSLTERPPASFPKMSSPTTYLVAPQQSSSVFGNLL